MATDLGSWDVIVMGAGPAGTTAAALLARQGHRILVLEKERFPRYHIGESLIPGCLRVFDVLGVRDEVERAGFVVKRGVSFLWGGDRDWTISFDEQRADPNYAFHVDRSRFDEILVANARRLGADVRDGVAVRDIDVDGAEAVVMSDAGVARARYVIDATGQNSILGRRLGKRHFDETLRNVAIWRYYKGCRRMPEPRSGYLAVVRQGDGWWWYIPLEPEDGGLTSVGVVLSTERYRRRGSNAELIFEEGLAASTDMGPWLDGAYPVSELRVTADWSYRSQQVAGERWLLAGDSAGFVDPLLATGCYLALTAGYLAGLCVGSTLREPTLGAAAFRYYDASYNRVVDEIHEMVRIFYKAARAEDAFAGAQTILGVAGDPRELFVRLAAGNVDESGDSGADLGGENALPSEVFGEAVHRRKPNHYGVPFATDRERVLGEVDPADLPAGTEPMMLVECDVQLRLVPASEIAKARDEQVVNEPPPQKPPLLLSEVRTDEDATTLLHERMPTTQRPAALLVFRDETEADSVVVGFAGAAATEAYWTRIGDVALFYFTDPGSSPFERPASRGLLDAVQRVAKACAREDMASPEALQDAVAARIAHPGWRVEARAAAAD
jgi:flavin-dependent dehydrogenase